MLLSTPGIESTLGRRTMIPLTFLLADTFTVITGRLFATEVLTVIWLTLAWATIFFFFATAGASSAYLTVSETFPMESGRW